jgi:hypothetical protein
LQRFEYGEKIWSLQVVGIDLRLESESTLVLLKFHYIEKKLLLGDLQHFEGDGSVLFLQVVSSELQPSVDEKLRGFLFF